LGAMGMGPRVASQEQCRRLTFRSLWTNRGLPFLWLRLKRRVICVNERKNSADVYKKTRNEGPPWTIGGTLFWALGGGLLFGHWSTIVCLFPFIFRTKRGVDFYLDHFFGSPGVDFNRARTKQKHCTFDRGG